MTTEITEKLVINSSAFIEEKTRQALSYYDRVDSLIKRTHIAMGRSVKHETTTSIASTLNGKIHPNCNAKTH